jgi:hypothetical protein
MEGKMGPTMAFPPTCISNLKSYTSNEDIGVDDDFNHRSLIQVQELKNVLGESMK